MTSIFIINEFKEVLTSKYTIAAANLSDNTLKEFAFPTPIQDLMTTAATVQLVLIIRLYVCVSVDGSKGEGVLRWGGYYPIVSITVAPMRGIYLQLKQRYSARNILH